MSKKLDGFQMAEQSESAPLEKRRDTPHSKERKTIVETPQSNQVLADLEKKFEGEELERKVKDFLTDPEYLDEVNIERQKQRKEARIRELEKTGIIRMICPFCERKIINTKTWTSVVLRKPMKKVYLCRRCKSRGEYKVEKKRKRTIIRPREKRTEWSFWTRDIEAAIKVAGKTNKEVAEVLRWSESRLSRKLLQTSVWIEESALERLKLLLGNIDCIT